MEDLNSEGSNMAVRISDPILSIRGLEVHYETPFGVVQAVSNVSLDVMKGEILAIVGESGCGKSTLGYAIFRLVPPPGKIVRGSIIFSGRDLMKLSDKELEHVRGKDLTMIFQDPTSSLNPVFRIGDQVMDVIKSKLGIKDDGEARKIALEALTKVKLPNPENIMVRYPHELSGGMMQRVVIAMAIATNPKLIVADEPTTALDVTIQYEILRLLLSLARELDLTVIIITHNMGVVSEVADRVAVMYAGKLVEIGGVRDVLKRPLHPYTRGLLKSVPRVDIDVEKLAAIEGDVPNLIDPPPGCRFHPRCEHVLDVCRTREPPLVEVKPGHRVACWLYGGVKER